MSKFVPDCRTPDEWVTYLNQIAEVLQDGTDLTPREVIIAAAADGGVVAEAPEESWGSFAIFITPDGNRIRGRLVGEQTAYVEPGGIGFELEGGPS